MDNKFYFLDDVRIPQSSNTRQSTSMG